SLLDMMSSGNLTSAIQLSPEDISRSAELKQRDKELTREWLAAVSSHGSGGSESGDFTQRAQNPGRLANLKSKQQALERDWQSFQVQLTLREGRKAMGAHAQTARMEEVARALPPDTALLEFVILRSPADKKEVEKPALFVTTVRNGKPSLGVF